jgi:DNA-binding transcriptional MerR regulator
MTTDSSVELLGSGALCEALDVDRATLTRWVANGIAQAAMKLPGPNGAYLFHPDELERLRQLRGDRKQMPRAT